MKECDETGTANKGNGRDSWTRNKETEKREETGDKEESGIGYEGIQIQKMSGIVDKEQGLVQRVEEWKTGHRKGPG